MGDKMNKSISVSDNKSKMKNKTCLIDGHKFDSVMEGKYYCYLKREIESGKILEIKLQPKIELQAAFDKNGEHHKPIMYYADFWVKYADGSEVYIDTKGMLTDVFSIKRKLFAFRYDTPLVVITASEKYSSTGWIETDKLIKIRLENKKLKKVVAK